MKFFLAIGFTLFLAITMIMNWAQCMPQPPPQCDPDVIDEAPYQLRKVCAALSTIYELSDAMRSYIAEKSRPAQHLPPYLRTAAEDEHFDNGVKRQDLDHVFLRFGKRRR